MNSAVVFGGYGVFGSHVARELARIGIPVVIAGRDGARAEAFARELGLMHRAVVADVTNLESCKAALAGQTVAVNCAGPFASLGATLLEACLETGSPYVDIADDRGYAAMVRSYSERFSRLGLVAAYGCSSLPGISGALGLKACEGISSAPERARVTLFVGNKNPKGFAAIRSLVGTLGNPIATPQGSVRGFSDREVVPLPEPFGARAVFNFESPDFDLLPKLLGVRSVSVKLGFELRIATYLFALIATLGSGYGNRLATFLERAGKLAPRIGSSGGAVMTEVFFADGSVRRASLVARQNGQRMAALPCAIVAEAICKGSMEWRGAMTACELLGAPALLDRLGGEGFELHCRTM